MVEKCQFALGDSVLKNRFGLKIDKNLDIQIKFLEINGEIFQNSSNLIGNVTISPFFSTIGQFYNDSFRLQFFDIGNQLF